MVTEIDALRILAGAETFHVASGGCSGSEGAVTLVAEGQARNVEKAIQLIESIKGEPVLKGFKGTCETCRYACRFAGTKLADLPSWLKD